MVHRTLTMHYMWRRGRPSSELIIFILLLLHFAIKINDVLLCAITLDLQISKYSEKPNNASQKRGTPQQPAGFVPQLYVHKRIITIPRATLSPFRGIHKTFTVAVVSERVEIFFSWVGTVYLHSWRWWTVSVSVSRHRMWSPTNIWRSCILQETDVEYSNKSHYVPTLILNLHDLTLFHWPNIDGTRSTASGVTTPPTFLRQMITHGL